MKTNIRQNEIKFLIGSDPELLLMSKGRIAPFKGDIKSEFGLDGQTGADKICEVRVNPTEDPIEMVNCIRGVFLRKVRHHPQVLEYNWYAGSYRAKRPLGGHIHASNNNKQFCPKVSNSVVANYAGAISLAVEDKHEAVRRRNGDHHYGFLNDMRLQPWGWEARCFSSWLTSPQIAVAHLALFKVVLNEFLNNKSFSPKERFTDKDFLSVNIKKVKDNFPSIWSEITQMSLYSQYKEYLDIFPFLIENNLTWYPKEQDLKINWGLCDNLKPEPKKVIDLKSIWNENTQAIFH